MAFENEGVYPVDTSSDVGQFRVLAGDAVPSEIDEGNNTASYAYWSDDEIEVYLATSTSVTWAIYRAYFTLASQAAIESKSVKDYDLQVNLTYRADDLREIARMWFTRAKDEDNAAGTTDVFSLFDTVPQGKPHAEASPYRRDVY